MGDRKHRNKMQPPILSPVTTGFYSRHAFARVQNACFGEPVT